jgi:hypothetical protein
MRKFAPLFSALVVGVGGLNASSAHAWSLETHLLIGEAVLEDVLPDGRVSLCFDDDDASRWPCDRQYLVPSAVVEALRANPGAYLMGNLGPDVYPDFVTGQVTTHPGVRGGWQTDDWLGALLRRAGDARWLAFAHGYAAHAAGDVFGHSYVNAYAGGIFDLGHTPRIATKLSCATLSLSGTSPTAHPAAPQISPPGAGLLVLRQVH